MKAIVYDFILAAQYFIFSAEKPANENALRFAGFRKNEFVKLRVLPPELGRKH